jgi:predicted RNA-binding protein with TRAM domain
VLEEGTIEKLAPVDSPVAEGQTVELKLVEVGRHDSGAAVGTVDGISVAVGGAARLVGKKVSAHVERVLDGVAYATLAGVETQAAAAAPITAEAQAEKPTRASRARKPETPSVEPDVEAESEPEAVADEPEEHAEDDVAAETAPKKKTRRGSRGGRNRRKKPAAGTDGAESVEGSDEADAAREPESSTDPAPTDQSAPKKKTRRGSRGGRGRKKPTMVTAETETNGQPETPPAEVPMPTIHVPSSEAADENITANGDEPAVSKKKTRRGSRGGRRRRKPTATASGGVSGTGGEPPAPEAGSDQA